MRGQPPGRGGSAHPVPRWSRAPAAAARPPHSPWERGRNTAPGVSAAVHRRGRLPPRPAGPPTRPPALPAPRTPRPGSAASLLAQAGGGGARLSPTSAAGGPGSAPPAAPAPAAAPRLLPEPPPAPPPTCKAQSRQRPVSPSARLPACLPARPPSLRRAALTAGRSPRATWAAAARPGLARFC